MASSHPYEEPSLTVILVMVGFLLLLNGVNESLDSFLYCGLVGQVFVGVLFGTPGAKLLSNAVETTVSNLGYLGLILLVYEGGLSTSLSGLISSSLLSVLVALTGTLLPMALSFLLLPLAEASPLQCFSAGASLSATSLGTAFATLSTGGLLNTHVGTVLSSAAMVDDVVGLIMLKVVTELSGGHGTASEYGKVVGRALGASVALVVLVAAICQLALRPLYKPIKSWAQSPKRGHVVKGIRDGPYPSLIAHTTLLLALIVAGSYAGTSVLLATFIGGVMVRWWDDEVTQGELQAVPSHEAPLTGLRVYEHYYGPSADRILKPFFFVSSVIYLPQEISFKSYSAESQASIGFSIPITQMFHASTVWKGLVYALLMFLGKVTTGLWLVPSSLESTTRSRISLAAKSKKKKRITMAEAADSTPNSIEAEARLTQSNARPEGIESPSLSPSIRPETVPPPTPTSDESMASAVASDANREDVTPLALNPNPGEVDSSPAASSTTSQPRNASLSASSPPVGPPEKRALRAYAPALLGIAMTARGEIGFLIASVAQSHGIFASTPISTSNSATADGADLTSELYLIVVWAIVLCTIVGPIAVGGLVRRVKRLEMQDSD